MNKEVSHKSYFSWICILISLLLVPLVSASNLYIEASQGEITSIIPFRYNEYYRQKFYFGLGESEQSSQFVSGNRVVLDLDSEINQVFVLGNIDYSKDYIFEINGEEHEISFCNNDGTCQPCFEGLCNVIENFLTCPNDCHSGSHDNFCDLQRDGICDPDCVLFDFDCNQCIENVCIYEGIQVQDTFCSDLGGVSCPSNRVCDGHLTYADDTGMFCCVGSCFENQNKIEEARRQQQELINERAQSDSFESAESNDLDSILYTSLIIIFLVLAIIIVVVSESKNIAQEHKIRKYVYDLVKSGYSIDQVESSLVQQNIEKETIKRVLKKYKKT